MKINRPLFWNSINLISILLYPLSLVTFFINILKKLLIKKNLKSKQFVLEIYMSVVLVKPHYQL